MPIRTTTMVDLREQIAMMALIDDHLCNVHFGSFLIGKLNERERRFF